VKVKQLNDLHHPIVNKFHQNRRSPITIVAVWHHSRRTPHTCSKCTLMSSQGWDYKIVFFLCRHHALLRNFRMFLRLWSFRECTSSRWVKRIFFGMIRRNFASKIPSNSWGISGYLFFVLCFHRIPPIRLSDKMISCVTWPDSDWRCLAIGWLICDREEFRWISVN
jgi:hypothetical protein